MKSIHTADWQLAKSYGRFDPDARTATSEARLDVIDSVARAAFQHDAQHNRKAGILPRSWKPVHEP